MYQFVTVAALMDDVKAGEFQADETCKYIRYGNSYKLYYQVPLPEKCTYE
jgi:hypothetical protein